MHPHDLAQCSEGLKDDFRALEIANDCTIIFELHVYSDGSAVQSKSWPRKTLSGGWSAVLFNVDPSTLVGAFRRTDCHSADSIHVHSSGDLLQQHTAELSAVVVPLWLLLGILDQPLHYRYGGRTVPSCHELQGHSICS